MMSSRRRAADALDASLTALIGDPERVHPKVRRYAVDYLSTELGKFQLFEAATGRALAKVIVHLYEGYDHSGVDPRYWPALGQFYKEIGDLMVSVGTAPQVVWPEHDRENAPTWADVGTPARRRSRRM